MKGPRGSRARLEKTAYHEAGHAVASYVLNVPLLSATIEPEYDPDYDAVAAGSVRNGPLANFDPEVESDPRTQRLVMAHIIVCYAGEAAAFRLCGRHDHAGAASDYHEASHWADHLIGDEDERIPLLEWLAARARTLISRPENWRAVEAVAKGLLEHGTLGAKRLRATIREARLPEATTPLGQRIRRVRQAKGWSQAVLAGRAGFGWLGHVTVSSMELGRSVQDAQELEAIAAALGVSAAALLQQDGAADELRREA